MKWSNEYKIPQSIADAITNDPYTKGKADFSVTELLKPPRQRALEKYHYDEIEKDVIDNLWILFGRSVHAYLENHSKGAITERRLYHTLPDGTTISGSMDSFILKEKILQDYKVTSVWAVKNIGTKVEWEEQLNIYAELCRQNKIEVNRLEIVAFSRDYREYEALRDDKYPAPVMVFPIEMWPPAMAYDFIRERVTLHKDAENTLRDIKENKLPEDALQECTEEEMWARPIKGTKLKKYARCEKYCQVSFACAQYKNIVGEQGESL